MAGFSVRPCGPKVSPTWVAAFRALPVAIISDSMARMTGCGANLRPLSNRHELAGPALTVRTRPGDNLMVHKAIQMASPGDVIVVDAGGELSNAIVGEMMISQCIKRQLAGIIIHGAIRDSAEIMRSDFPVFASGVTHRGPFKDGPGDINETISVDGLVVNPGDLVCGDADGIVAVRLHNVKDIFETAQQKLVAETAFLREIWSGTEDNEWIDKTLADRGCHYFNEFALPK